MNDLVQNETIEGYIYLVDLEIDNNENLVFQKVNIQKNNHNEY
jgi:hypothetical protein